MSGESLTRSSGGTAHRRSSCGSGSPWSHTRSIEEKLSDPISPPRLLCACKIPLSQKRSNTTRNPNRDFYACSRIGTNEAYSCKTWIWVDLVRDYVEQLVSLRTRNLEVLEKELAAVQRELKLKTDALVCREIEMEEQGSIHQAAISELKAQLVSLQSQTKALKSSALKFKKIRMLMLMYVAVCWFSAGSLPMTLAATLRRIGRRCRCPFLVRRRLRCCYQSLGCLVRRRCCCLLVARRRRRPLLSHPQPQAQPQTGQRIPARRREISERLRTRAGGRNHLWILPPPRNGRVLSLDLTRQTLPARGGKAGSPDDDDGWRTGRETEQSRPPPADQPLPARRRGARSREGRRRSRHGGGGDRGSGVGNFWSERFLRERWAMATAEATESTVLRGDGQ